MCVCELCLCGHCTTYWPNVNCIMFLQNLHTTCAKFGHSLTLFLFSFSLLFSTFYLHSEDIQYIIKKTSTQLNIFRFYLQSVHLHLLSVSIMVKSHEMVFTS
ncbi:hypothetical protein NL108_013369 [Boleophthalmus pectinirostris]|nr:hypothetical protein NL108_013369 [Boleophthalmus pectinirostris]